MFRSNSKKGQVSKDTPDTVISRSTVIKGELGFSGGLHVDGHIYGDVKVDPQEPSLFVLSEAGLVRGTVVAPNQIINGTIEGDIRAEESLALEASARINGNVYYRMLKMDMGATVNGQLIRLDDQSTPALLEGKAVKNLVDQPEVTEAANS
ncbi:bactofilin family protein [Pelagibaculum spongiae]|nr:polymer-forming cytoskeletal protein [Pelagibaculum spongiae]